MICCIIIHPYLNTFVGHSYFDYAFGASSRHKMSTDPNSYFNDKTKETRRVATISQNKSYLDQIASGQIEFADLVRSFYHELVHVKQIHELDGFSKKSYQEDEFVAYYTTLCNESLLNTKMRIHIIKKMDGPQLIVYLTQILPKQTGFIWSVSLRKK